MTPREPDRFDKQARELVAKWYGPPLSRESVPWIAAALRAAESSALERAAQLCDSRAANMDGKESLEIATLQLRGAAEGIRALIPPAAAPVAEPRLDNLAAESPAPAAETHVMRGDTPIAVTEWDETPCSAVLVNVNRVCELPMHHEGDHRWNVGEGEYLTARHLLIQRVAAPAAETGKVDARDVFGWGNDGPGSNYPAPAQGPWRVGTKYGIHVYDGDRPVATFFRAEDARRAVDAQARIAELETALLDFLCGHGPPPDCAGKGECVCDAAWPLFDLPHGAVDLARRLRTKRAAPPKGEGKL